MCAKYEAVTRMSKNLMAGMGCPSSVLLHSHLYADVPPWPFALSIYTAQVAADQARDTLPNPQNLISIAARWPILEFQIRHAETVVYLPNAHLFDSTDSRVGFQAFDDVSDGQRICWVLVAHEKH